MQPSFSAPSAAPNVLQQAQQQWPILNQYNLQYKSTPRTDRGFLEFWPPNETGTPAAPRPKEFAPGQMGVEIYKANTRPIDVLGDVVSHYMRQNDPRVKGYYEQFAKSITPEQEQRLREQYQHAQQREGEQRPYAQWREMSGLPAYFRGYAFQQWSPEFNAQAYTPEQRQMFDAMMSYLGGGK
jgi:hypothetical protein